MSSEEFNAKADYQLGKLLSEMTPPQAAWASQAEYLTKTAAEATDMNATGTPKGYVLLGMYQYEPHPRVTIFENSLKQKLDKFGTVDNAIYEALKHEIYQHHFGEDHTKEEAAHGHAPAYMLPFNTEEDEVPQWLAHRLMGLHSDFSAWVL